MAYATREELLAAAQGVLAHNWTGSFTKPTEHLYPHQWNWDSGFIAIGYGHYDFERAVTELKSLYRGQWRNGMLPHIVFREDPQSRYFPGPDFWETHRAEDAPTAAMTSGITQPPVQGWALWHIVRATKDRRRAREVVNELLPLIRAQHEYLYLYRDPNKEGLVYVRHPWESGTDNSPAWDDALKRFDPSEVVLPVYQRQDNQIGKVNHRPTQRDYDYYVYLLDVYRRYSYEEGALESHCPFRIQDPMFNAILARSGECMSELAEWVGAPTDSWVRQSTMTRRALYDKLWDPQRGTFDAWDLAIEQRIPLETNSGLIPIIAGSLPNDEVAPLLRRIESPAFSGEPQSPAFLIPTLALNDPRLDIEKYWRGPVWINMNWMLYEGLLRYGAYDTAARIREDSLHLIQTYGFQEYFLPYQQLPAGVAPHLGAGKFSWTASLCIDWLMRSDAV